MSIDELIKVLKSLGLSNDQINRFINGSPIDKEDIAWSIYRFFRSRGEVVYEDEVGGLYSEPAYVAIIKLNNVLLAYFSAPRKHYVILRHVGSLDEMIRLAKDFLRMHEK